MRASRVFCLTGAAWAIFGAAVYAQVRSGAPASLTERRQSVRSLNNELLRMHAGSNDGSPSANVRTLLQQRAEALAELARVSPADALNLTFEPKLVESLSAAFPEAAAELESYGTWEGALGSWVHEYPDGSHREVREMQTGGVDLEVTFAGAEPPNLRCGAVVRASGVRLGNQLLAVSAETNVASTGATATCSTTGVQNILALMVTPANVTPPSTVTQQSIRDILFGSTGQSVDGFWRESSGGQTSAAGDVYGWYTLPATYACDQLTSLYSDALELAIRSGIAVQNYNRIFMVVPNLGCGWSGIASIGCSSASTSSGSIYASTSYLNADFVLTQPRNSSVQLAAHEGGHNLGLDHAHGLTFSGESLGPLGEAGTMGEYGDMFSDMGNQLTGHYAAYHKAMLNWMAPGIDYAEVRDSGTWFIQPSETPTSGLRALKVQRGTGNNAWLWIEYRQPIGIYDSSFSNNGQVYTGALVHYDDGSGSLASNLLAFGPASTGLYTPALAAGQTWKDPYTNLSISVGSASESGLTVSINYGAAVCAHAAPALGMSPANPSITPGGTLNYTVSVTNNDSASCAASPVVLSAATPAGWNWALSPDVLMLSPGQSGSATLTLTAPSGALPATYDISTGASANSYSSSAPATCTVVAPAAVSNLLSVAGATYSARQTVSATSKVVNGSAPVARASVTFKLTKANGAVVSTKATTDGNGLASWSYKIGQKDPKGNYILQSSVTYQQSTIASNTVSFTVR